MYADLHAHTTASDGSLEPEELVNLGKSIGLKALAVTDHDTVAGVARALAQGEKVGLEVIAGVEISSNLDDCDVHLLGLFLDPHNEEFLHRLTAMGEARARRNDEMVDSLQKAGINITREDLPSTLGGKQIARGHIAQILMERGYATGLREALDKFLVKGAVGYVKKAVLSVEECIDLVHKAGGLIFVAHLHQIDPQNPDHCLAIAEKILAMGADGIETIYSEYNDHWSETTEAMAQRLGVLRSGGSDFHGEMKQHLSLGSGYGHLKVPYDFVGAMKEKLGKK